MKIALSILAAVAALLLLPLLPALFAPGTPPAADTAKVPAHGMPWQIDVLPDGRTRVFGMTPGSSLLADARGPFGNTYQLAVVAPKDGSPSLEAYFDVVMLGALSGKAVLTIEASATELGAMIERAGKADFMATGTRKYRLAESDFLAAEQRPIRAILFIPSPNLDEQIILQRFGTPATRIRQGDTLEHFLYPEKGLDVVLDSQGKEVLQYVAPSNFGSLRDPLLNSKVAQ